MEPMDIFIANVPFDEGKGSEIRPALVIEVKSEKVIIFENGQGNTFFQGRVSLPVFVF